MTAAGLEELLRTVRYRIGPYSPHTSELPEGAIAAIVAVLMPVLRDEAAP